MAGQWASPKNIWTSYVDLTEHTLSAAAFKACSFHSLKEGLAGIKKNILTGYQIRKKMSFKSGVSHVFYLNTHLSDIVGSLSYFLL